MKTIRKAIYIAAVLGMIMSCTRYVPVFIPFSDGESEYYTDEFRIEVADRTGGLVDIREDSVLWESGTLSIGLELSDPAMVSRMEVYINGEDAESAGVSVETRTTAEGCICIFSGIAPGTCSISFVISGEGSTAGSITVTAHVPAYISIRPTV